MLYEEALQQARDGRVDAHVIAVMEKELAAAERTATPDWLANVRLNLAVALIQFGNDAATAEEYTRHYRR